MEHEAINIDVVCPCRIISAGALNGGREMNDLKRYCGHLVADDGELSSLHDVIAELEQFIEQFSTHAMNDSATSYLQGQLAAYQDVIDYLSRVAPIQDEELEKDQ